MVGIHLCKPDSPVSLKSRTPPIQRDGDDKIVLEVAGNGDADFIVTHNLRDVETARNLGTVIATLNETLERGQR